MIHSLAGVADKTNSYRVFLFISDCEPSLVHKAKNSFKRLPNNIRIEFFPISKELPSTLLPKRSNVSAAIWNKLLLYQDLPQDVSRVLFIDADVVLCQNPALLFNTALEGHVIAAVREKLYLLPDLPPTRKDVLGLRSYEQYFNSGVMLVDVLKWREHQISERSLQFAVEKWGDTPYHDQDAFNAVISGQWKAISPLWNPRGLNEIQLSDSAVVVLTNHEIYRLGIQNLVHYSGAEKPWLFTSEHPANDLYWHWLKRSAFSDYRPPDKTFYTWCSKRLRRAKRLIRDNLRI